MKMGRRGLSFIVGALGIVLEAGAGFSQVQPGFGDPTTQTAAQNLANQQGAATGSLVSTTTSTATSTLPIAGSDVSGLSSYSGNPTAMQNAGSAAYAADPTVLLAQKGAQNQATQKIDPNAAWLKNAYAVQLNPQNTVASTGSGQQQCTTTTTPSTTTAQDGTYTCEKSQSVTDTTSACKQDLTVAAYSTWYYSCQSTYDQTNKVWVPSAACNALAGSSTCNNTGTTCSAPPTPYFQATNCTTGVQWGSSDKTCVEGRKIVTGTKYNYQCTNNFDSGSQTWSTSAACSSLAGSGACVQTSSNCSQQAPDSTVQCQLGVDNTPSQSTCTENWTVNVGTYYFYDGTKTWNGSTWVPDAPETALTNAGNPPCQIIATNCSQGSGLPSSYTCTAGYQVSSSNGVCAPAVVGNYVQNSYDLGSGYTRADFSYYYGGATILVFSGDQHANLTIVNGVTGGNCIPDLQSGTQQTNGSFTYHTGQVLYRYAGLYCKSPITVAGVAGGNSLTFDNVHAATSPSLPSTKAFVNAANGNIGVNNPANVQMIVDLSNLVGVASAKCPSGIASMQYTWLNNEQVQYAATSNVNFPGCNAPAGMTVDSSTCAATYNGQCTATTYVYKDPSHGCYNYTDKWQCTQPIAGAGQPTSTQPYLISQGWDGGCSALASNASCSYASTNVTQGPDTRTISGLTVTASAWQQQKTYSCAASHPVDTCTSQDVGCTLKSQSCAQTDANQNCTLYNNVYSCPSNKCVAQTYTYVCTQDVPPADPYQSSYPYLVSDAYDPAACAALDSNANCHYNGSTYDGADTKSFNGLQVSEPNWNQTRAYTCQAGQTIDGCTGNVNGCTFVSKSCIGYDPSHVCSLWSNTYSCPADDGSGGCGKKVTTYTCSADVPPADPADKIETTVTSAKWTPENCPEASNKMCAAQGPPTCTDANSTKTIAGGQVTQPCWSQTTNYTCETLGPETNTCQVPAGCTLQATKCLDDAGNAAGKCVNTEYDYSCTSTSTSTKTTSTCQSQMCVGSQCFKINGTQDSNKLGQAYAALSTAQQGGSSYAATNNLEIMKGTVMGCHKSITGFSNCCSDSGWGLDIGFASCGASEKQLIEQQKKKACHYVGTYCSNKSFFGICLQKTMHYCCFGSSLPRIINEAGRPQINKGWGSAKNPDCSGFTVSQFQQLDLTNVDFSDFYNTTLGNLTNPSSSPVVSQITNSLTALGAAGVPNQTPH